VHCYTFSRNETPEEVRQRVEAALGGPLDVPPSIHTVRDVSPNKLMLCVSFQLPEGVAFAGRQAEGAAPAAGGEADQQRQQQEAAAGVEGDSPDADPAVKRQRTGE
jgi:hypothetical protein